MAGVTAAHLEHRRQKWGAALHLGATEAHRWVCCQVGASCWVTGSCRTVVLRAMQGGEQGSAGSGSMSWGPRGPHPAVPHADPPAAAAGMWSLVRAGFLWGSGLSSQPPPPGG